MFIQSILPREGRSASTGKYLALCVYYFMSYQVMDSVKRFATRRLRTDKGSCPVWNMGLFVCLQVEPPCEAFFTAREIAAVRVALAAFWWNWGR